MKNTLFLLLVGLSLIAVSCKTSSGVKKEPELRGNSLANELRKLPGVTVRGDDTNGSVMVGGYSTTSISNSNPLFVIDGVRSGKSLPQAAGLISVPQIRRIRVLKPAEAFPRYGEAGANGVIEIRMNKEKKEEQKE